MKRPVLQGWKQAGSTGRARRNGGYVGAGFELRRNRLFLTALERQAGTAGDAHSVKPVAVRGAASPFIIAGNRLKSLPYSSVRSRAGRRVRAMTAPKRVQSPMRAGAMAVDQPPQRDSGFLQVPGWPRFFLHILKLPSFRCSTSSNGRTHDHGKAGQEYVNV